MSADENDYCPALPPHMVGVTHEPDLNGNKEIGSPESFNGTEDDDLDMYCPALPPHLAKETSDSLTIEKKVLGPSLPKNYQPPPGDDSNKGYLIESESEEECEDVVGPLPASVKEDPRFDEEEILLRAYNLRKGINEDDEKPTRESWMLELPTDKPNILALGLGSRQFRKKAVEYGDRTVWTDTPEDKEKKAKQLKCENKTEEDSISSVANKRRDEELTAVVNKYTEVKRSVPLIESHGKKRKQNEDSTLQQRKPFSRDEDLAVNKFDDAQKKTILKKARQLNDRFSAGKQKFL